MTAQQPIFNLGLVAKIPAGSEWDQEFTLYEPNASSTDADYSAVLAAADVVRFRMWLEDATTVLVTATDQVASANGTTVTIETRGVADTTPARITVAFDGDDTDQTEGTYMFLVDVQDDSDSSRWQPACRGTIQITEGAP